jgi:hypothetical protein
MNVKYKLDGLITDDLFEEELEKFSNAINENYVDGVDFNPFELCDDLQKFRSNIRIKCTNDQYSLFYKSMLHMMSEGFNEFLAKGTYGKDFDQINKFLNSIYFDVEKINLINITQKHRESTIETVHEYADIIYQFKRYKIIDVAVVYFYNIYKSWSNYFKQLNNSGIDLVGEFQKKQKSQKTENHDSSNNKKLWLGKLNGQRIKNQFFLIMMTFFELGVFDKTRGNQSYFINGLSALLGEDFKHCKKNAFNLWISEKNEKINQFELIEQVTKKYNELFYSTKNEE